MQKLFDSKDQSAKVKDSYSSFIEKQERKESKESHDGSIMNDHTAISTDEKSYESQESHIKDLKKLPQTSTIA